MTSKDKSAISAFDFETFSDYFAHYLALQSKVKKNFSYRQLCRRTGIKSPAMLTWLAKGTRLPTPYILEQLREVMEWKPGEFAYIQSMVNAERSESTAEKEYHQSKMRELKPAEPTSLLENETISIFSKWFLIAILEMTNLADFDSSPIWICERLGGRISEEDAASAIELLLKVGLLEKSPDGRLSQPLKRLRTKDNAPITAVRKWHEEMMRLGQNAVHLQEPEHRFFSGISLAIDSSEMAEAQKVLGEFRERFISRFEKKGGNEVYHFAIQYFGLTQPVRPKVTEQSTLSLKTLT